MKILDIITPNETLTEADNFLTRWFARSLGRSAGTTAEKKVSAWVDSAIRELEASTPGHEIKRTEELKRAESSLISVMERNPYPQEAEKIDSIAQSLAEYLARYPGRELGDNAVKKLVELVRLGSVEKPKFFDSKAEFLRDPFITSEMRGGVIVPGSSTTTEMAGSKYIRELAEAKTQVYNEIKNIQPVKTKEQLKKEKEEADIDARNRETNDLRSKNELQKEKLTAGDLAVEQANKDGRSFWQKNKIGLIFGGTEVGRISLQASQQINNVSQWKDGWKDGTPIPPEIAKFFPAVPEGGVKKGDPSIKSLVTGRDGKPYYYRTNRQRYDQAAWYAWQTITNLWMKQVCSGTIAWWAPSLTAKSVEIAGTRTAGLIGKGKWAHDIVEFFNKAWAKNTMLVKILDNMSIASKMLFADYMMTNVVAEQDSSQNFAYWINSLVGHTTGIPTAAVKNAANEMGLSDYTPEELEDARKGLSLLPESKDPIELNKALAAISIGASIEELPEGYVKDFLITGLKTYAVPYTAATQIIANILIACFDAGKYFVPLVVKAMGTTKGKLPNNNDKAVIAPPAEPATRTEPDANAQQDQTDLSGSEQSAPAPAAPASAPAPAAPASAPAAPASSPEASNKKAKKPAVTNPELDPFTLQRESVRESLKRRVEKLMRS
jgi:hypothetical protein